MTVSSRLRAIADKAKNAARSLTFDSASHTYALDCKSMISVSALLDMAGLGIEWRASEFVLSRANAAHMATAFNDKGTLREDTVHPEVMPYLMAWRGFRANMRADVVMVEERLVVDPAVAGTLDRLMVFGHDRKSLCVVDVKTGVEDIVRWRAQLMGYAVAMGRQHVKAGRVKRAVVTINAGGKWAYIPLDRTPADTEIDLAAWDAVRQVDKQAVRKWAAFRSAHGR